MMTGPPDPDVDFCPTQIDQVIALPFTVMLFIPVVSGEHVPFAVGSDVGIVPPPLSPLLPASALWVLPELEPELPDRDEPLLEPLPDETEPVLDPELDPAEPPLCPETSDPLDSEPLDPLVPSDPEALPPPEPLLPGGVKRPWLWGVALPHAKAALKTSKPSARRMTTLPGVARARAPYIEVAHTMAAHYEMSKRNGSIKTGGRSLYIAVATLRRTLVRAIA